MPPVGQERPALEILRNELRRGSIVLAVLSALRCEQNGSELRRRLAAADVPIEEGALYPMLRRLEAQTLLTSEWRLEDARHKRFYRLTDKGLETLSTLASEWQRLVAAIEKVMVA